MKHVPVEHTSLHTKRYIPSSQIIRLVQREIGTTAVVASPAVELLLVLPGGGGDVDQIISTLAKTVAEWLHCPGCPGVGESAMACSAPYGMLVLEVLYSMVYSSVDHEISQMNGLRLSRTLPSHSHTLFVPL